jgi:hypothetical protein
VKIITTIAARNIMRLSNLALFTLLSSSASAFAPAPIFSSPRNSPLQVSKSDNNNEFSNPIEGAKNAFLGTVTAATLLMGTLAPLPGDLSVAIAATAAPPAAATASKTVAAAKKAEPAAPLAVEKAAVASAKAAFAATQKVSDIK